MQAQVLQLLMLDHINREVFYVFLEGVIFYGISIQCNMIFMFHKIVYVMTYSTCALIKSYSDHHLSTERIEYVILLLEPFVVPRKSTIEVEYKSFIDG